MGACGAILNPITTLHSQGWRARLAAPSCRTNNVQPVKDKESETEDGVTGLGVSTGVILLKVRYVDLVKPSTS